MQPDTSSAETAETATSSAQGLLEARIAELEMLLANEQKESEKAWKEAEDMYVAYDGERKKRNAAEKQCAALQEQLHQVRGGADVAGERAARRAAEVQCAILQEQLTTMSKKANELEGQVQMQKSVSGLCTGASWQYEMDGRWEAFTPEANETMHQAYLIYLDGVPCSRYATINSGGVARLVDFEQMQQKHLATQKIRRIRVLAGVPPQWVTPAADLLQQGSDLRSYFKEVTDPEIWQSVRTILHSTGHAWDQYSQCFCMSKTEILSVHRIENMRLWHRYKTRLAAMRQDHATYNISVRSADLDMDGIFEIMTKSQQAFDCGEALALDVDEKILLHGTSYNNASSIISEGFDHRTCQSALYGLGVYFACAACKSDQYTLEHDYLGRTLIIARVALGDSYVARETRLNQRRPPVRPSAGTYDSIVVKPGPIDGHQNQQQFHQEFVIFDRDQAYPCYVVQYLECLTWWLMKQTWSSMMSTKRYVQRFWIFLHVAQHRCSILLIRDPSCKHSACGWRELEHFSIF